ncbi:gamma-glutamylcyclotransferase family protein [Motilimonas eburnea]|uniref:gamma-glutamylcyclotransferase family protein n=1 Tax=Motilimonas eburnea TaxID=1737488 RepID=UPI001E50D72D|nr:gamma-glutamylcyclotransferase family protein [Motilimonas eburnea]MCE2571171.1 gamma-glutamylcyclotransferase [Motilimonas eburnea]
MLGLFVYGTLRPNEINHHYLKDLNGDWRSAHIQATLYETGLGPTSGFKVVDLSQPTQSIEGMIVFSEALEQAWPALDEFEGEGYVRQLTTAIDNEDKEHQVFVYALDEKYFYLRP